MMIMCINFNVAWIIWIPFIFHIFEYSFITMVFFTHYPTDEQYITSYVIRS